MNPSLYIIVPIFNSLAYLKDCLDSIKAQTYSDFIAVCVDDGSSDESFSFLCEYAKQDSRFVPIRQENQGVGVSRNTAIEYILAQQGGGQCKDSQREIYVGFVDSDDMIASDYFEQLIFALCAHKAKLAKTKNVTKFHDNPPSFETPCKKSKGTLHNAHKNLAYKTEPWRCLFELELLAQLRFPPIRNGEDVVFGICANALAGKVVFSKTARYFHRKHPHSLSSKPSPEPKTKSAEDYPFTSFCWVVDFFLTHNLVEKLTIPTQMIRPPLSYVQSDPLYYDVLKSKIQAYHLNPNALKKQYVLKILLSSKDFASYIKQTMSFAEWWKYNFRIKYNKKEKIIKLFGKILYKNITIHNKWN